jgi:hypothetical protein
VAEWIRHSRDALRRVVDVAPTRTVEAREKAALAGSEF